MPSDYVTITNLTTSTVELTSQEGSVEQLVPLAAVLKHTSAGTQACTSHANLSIETAYGNLCKACLTNWLTATQLTHKDSHGSET